MQGVSIDICERGSNRSGWNEIRIWIWIWIWRYLNWRGERCGLGAWTVRGRRIWASTWECTPEPDPVLIPFRILLFGSGFAVNSIQLFFLSFFFSTDLWCYREILQWNSDCGEGTCSTWQEKEALAVSAICVRYCYCYCVLEGKAKAIMITWFFFSFHFNILSRFSTLLANFVKFLKIFTCIFFFYGKFWYTLDASGNKDNSTKKWRPLFSDNLQTFTWNL